MNSIKSILLTILSSNPHIPKWHFVLFTEWNIIAGTLKDDITIIKIQESTLIIGVYNIHLMYQLHIISGNMIESINKKLNNRYISDIQFRQIKKPFIKKDLLI